MNIILFHALKHHLEFGSNWLDSNFGQWNDSLDKDLKSLGNSVLDYYFGMLTVRMIKDEVLDFLSKQNLTDKKNYEEWISDNNGFREINLSDDSQWTLRFINKPLFVHLHPSRHSNHTQRTKANTLKTVLCTLLFEKRNDFSINIPLINTYRKNYLGISPIKNSTYHSELENLFSLFYM